MAQQLSTNTFGCAKWIVSSDATQGTHTTIAAALTSASSGDTIFIRPGTYTENLTLKAGVDISAYPCDAGFIQNNASGTANAKIIGKLTANDLNGDVTISGIWLQTNADYAITITGTLLTRVCLNGCTIIAADNTALNNSNSNAASRFVLNYCCGNILTTGIAIFTLSNGSTSGNLNMNYCNFSNSGNSTTANTCASGSYAFIRDSVIGPVTTSEGSGIDSSYTSYTGAVTANGTAVTRFQQCKFTTGTSAVTAISIGSGATALVLDAVIESTNTNAISGSGTLQYAGLAFVSSGGISVTTQVPLISSNDAKTVVTPGAYPYTVKPQDALILVDTASARTINLEASPATGVQHIIKDNVGSAGTNNITVTPAAGNIDGSASYAINSNYASITVRYNGTQWNII